MTAVLFTQHLWTLIIAVTTYALLVSFVFASLGHHQLDRFVSEISDESLHVPTPCVLVHPLLGRMDHCHLALCGYVVICAHVGIRFLKHMLTDLSTGWYVAFGFSPSAGGALCYYAPGNKTYDRSLVQFIPRWVSA